MEDICRICEDRILICKRCNFGEKKSQRYWCLTRGLLFGTPCSL